MLPQGTRALVTGASGFIGSRLVERLVLEAGAQVRALVRTYGAAAALARFPVELMRGDVLDRDSLRQAIQGCDVIFHCATGTSWILRERRRVEVEGARHVLEEAASAGGVRVVQLSSVLVYGITPDGEIEETSPRRRTGDLYADAKLQAEQLATRFASRVPVTVLQPTAVYGPWAGVYGRSVLNSLRSGRVPLVDGGHGICNIVYVDDLVSALLASASRPEAAGESFLVTGPDHVTWRTFYERFARMLGVTDRTIDVPLADVVRDWRRSGWKRPGLVGETVRALGQARLRERVYETREGAAAMRVAQAVLPPAVFHAREARSALGATTPTNDSRTPPVHAVRPFTARFQATRTHVRIDKARRVLGYEPVFDFDTGMRLTEQWARWAGLVD
jgi:nucleoside-diphosphate-sugar epimerase